MAREKKAKCDFAKYLKDTKCPYAGDPMMLIACEIFKLRVLIQQIQQTEMMMGIEPDIEGYA